MKIAVEKVIYGCCPLVIDLCTIGMVLKDGYARIIVAFFPLYYHVPPLITQNECNSPLHWPHPYALPSMETAVVIRRVLKSGIGSGNCCSICAILPVKGNDKHIERHNEEIALANHVLLRSCCETKL